MGLGKAKVAVEIAITWPATGQIQTFYDIAADQVLQIRDGDDRPVPVDRHPFSFSNSRDGHQH
jgi:hypothetical protein